MSLFDTMLLAFFLLPLGLGAVFVLVYRAHRSASGMRATWLLLSGNVCAGLLLVSLLLPAGEIYYRYFYDETDGWDWGLVSARWYRRHYRPNNFQIRDNIQYRLKRNPAKRRLTILGDSFANGHGLRDVELRFANRLRRRDSGREVHLLSHDGIDTGEIIHRLERMLDQGYELDEVLYAYCVNDIVDISDEWLRAQKNILAVEEPWPVRHSYFLNTLFYRYRTLFDGDAKGYLGYIVNAHGNETWNRHAARLRGLRDTIQAHGGRLRVVTFPFFEMRSSADFQAIHAQLGTFWSGLGVPHLDLTEVYRGIPSSRLRVHGWDSHPNGYANALAADAIEEFLKEARRVDQ